jgi:hypothetical protein
MTRAPKNAVNDRKVCSRATVEALIVNRVEGGILLPVMLVVRCWKRFFCSMGYHQRLRSTPMTGIRVTRDRSGPT